MRKQIPYSFHFALGSLMQFISDQPFLFIIIAVVLIRSVISRIIKGKLKRKYILPYE